MAERPKLLLLSCGATMFQAAQAGGTMALAYTAQDLLRQAGAEHLAEVTVRDLGVRSGAELTWETLFEIRDAVRLAAGTGYASYVLIIGTDTLDEAAFSLHLLLETHLRSLRRCLVVTGAMKPADQLGADGPANVAQALQLALDPTAQAAGTVLVAMNDSIHLGSRVCKVDSQLIGAFRSHPGPAGQFRGGRPQWAWQPPPSSLAEPAFASVALTQPLPRVAIWTVAVGGMLPPEELLQALDGLVLAAPGTGSLPAALVRHLTEPGPDTGRATGELVSWAQRLPIVVTSRCATGENFDEFYYKGSRAKYESRGFLLAGGYEQLSALQARCLLVLRLLAAEGSRSSGDHTSEAV